MSDEPRHLDGGAPMSPDVLAFMTDSRRTAKVAVVLQSGEPCLQPAWFDVDGDDLILMVDPTSDIGRNFDLDQFVCVCLDDVDVPYGFVSLEGRANRIEDQAEAVGWFEKLLRKYRDGIPDPATYARQLRDEYGLAAIRVRLDGGYFEPSVAPPPATASTEGASA